MADGSTKAIEEVDVGDLVVAADPESGEQGVRPVTDLIVGEGVKHLIDIEVDGHLVTATDHHPFWVDDQGRWVDAEDLEPGDVLLLASGATVEVDAVRQRTEVRRVHNLTVEGIHTYHVLVGDQPVLVHNCREVALGRDLGGPRGGKHLAERTGGSWWKNWGEEGITSRRLDSHFGRAFHHAVKRAERIHFSLDGIGDIQGAIRAGAAGFRKNNFTNAELHFLVSTPGALAKTTFYRDGLPVQFHGSALP